MFGQRKFGNTAHRGIKETILVKIALFTLKGFKLQRCDFKWWFGGDDLFMDYVSKKKRSHVAR
jgi:hypothetical protein